MTVDRLFQDVNISELMKKLDILGDNGVTMSVGWPLCVCVWARTQARCVLCDLSSFVSTDRCNVRLLCGLFREREGQGFQS